MATAADWSDAELDPRKILLDVKNPRIEVKPTATQDEIRRKLMDFEEVLDLARKIEKNNGLLKGEKIITVVEGGKHVVLEGNRRVAACQMLLNPKLVPSDYSARFPSGSAATKAAIRVVASDVSPDRETAEPILTMRHTERGAKPWSPVAKMRRAVQLLDTMSIEAVAAIQGTSAAQVRKLIRPYRLLKFAMDLPGWTEGERKVLEDEKLKTNPYTRFFTLSGTKDALQIHFDADENVVSALPAKVFKAQMMKIARDFLIPDPANRGRPRCDTRTLAESYFADFLSSPEGKAAAEKRAESPSQSPDGKSGVDPNSGGGPRAGVGGAGAKGGAAKPGGTGGATKPVTRKASVFFENLECHVQDDILITLAQELRDINHRKFTVAASLLMRSLFEYCLVYKLKATKKWAVLLKEYHQNPKKQGADPMLQDIIKFCSKFENGVFVERNICKTLNSSSTTQAKVYLDAMVHMKYQEADVIMLESTANHLRQIIAYILAGN